MTTTSKNEKTEPQTKKNETEKDLDTLRVENQTLQTRLNEQSAEISRLNNVVTNLEVTTRTLASLIQMPLLVGSGK